MSSVLFLDSLPRRGVHFLADGERLRVINSVVLSAGERAFIAKNRAALLAVLKLREFSGALSRGELPANEITGRRLMRLDRRAEIASGFSLTLDGDLIWQTVAEFDAGAAYRENEQHRAEIARQMDELESGARDGSIRGSARGGSTQFSGSAKAKG